MKISIYIRVSTEDQVKEGYSLEVQREYLEDFAKQLVAQRPIDEELWR